MSRQFTFDAAPIAVAALGLILTGCSGSPSTDAPASPTTTGFSVTSAIQSPAAYPPLPAEEAAFLAALDSAGLPRTHSDWRDVANGRTVCATLTTTDGDRTQAAVLFSEDGGLAYVNIAADNLCPDLTPTAPATSTAPAGPADSFYAGTHVVGTDIEPGTYRSQGPVGEGGLCYWARLKDTTGDFEAIITNGTPEGPTTVTIKASDGAFETSGCGQWTKVK